MVLCDGSLSKLLTSRPSKPGGAGRGVGWGVFCFYEIFLTSCGITGSLCILTTSLCSQVMWVSSCALETSNVIFVSTGMCGLVEEVAGGEVRDG